MYPPKDTDVNPEIDVAEHFLDKICTEADDIWQKHIKTETLLQQLTSEEQKDFYRNYICHICNEEITDPKDKCNDHNHATSDYRGIAHNQCNGDYHLIKESWKLIVMFHNLKRYNAHLIIKAIKKRHGEIKIIPANMETFISFIVGRVCFIDSFAFAPMSLEELVENTLKEGDFNNTEYKATDIDNLKPYAKQKGMFPYDFLDNTDKFKFKDIPDISTFYDTLSDSPCTVENYQRAQEVWKYCNPFRDYHDFYLKCNVLILADFMEKLRNNCLENFHLDPANYVSLPGWSWEAALKMSKVELELLDNGEMYAFFEKAIRGGISQVTKRYSNANNKYLSDFNPFQPIICLMYFDANNLYGHEMMSRLPTKNFK